MATANTETILVVDDEPAILDLVAGILKNNGYSVLPACGAEEALRVTGEHANSLNLVLTDIVMPGLSGGELVQRIMLLKPGIHVLYMSGYTKYTVVNHGILESVSSFIWKPFSPEELLQKVREVLDSPVETA